MSRQKHLSQEERYYIETEVKREKSGNSIAKALGRPQSTISREIKRNSCNGKYSSSRAGQMAADRHMAKRKAIKLTESVKEMVRERIEQDWSPEQVSGRLEMERGIRIHFSTIYRYLKANKREGGTLYFHLRRPKAYRCKYGTPSNRSGNPGRIDIDQRPKIVNERGRPGDWEGDTVTGKRHKGVIVTVDERKSKLRLAIPTAHKRAEEVKDALVSLLDPVKEFVKTITFDNGKEFTQHGKISEALDCDNYFAKPYHAWERGQNENANGLLRQYFPKGTDLSGLTNKEVFSAVWKLNDRPRKCLGYKTPFESFEELTGTDVKNLEGYAFMMQI